MPKLIERKEYLENLKKFRDIDVIKVITGVRRCGKSTLFDLYIEHLKNTGIVDEQIISINLEKVEYDHLLDYKSLHDYVKSRLCKGMNTYVFIDEVQMCKNFEKAIDSLYVEKAVDVYITGSNANMLSGELATLLSGRYVEIKMLPLSFSEYSVAFHGQDERRRFRNYLNFGAFPVLTHSEFTLSEYDQLLLGIYNTILVKDVATREGITDITVLQAIAKFLASCIGSPIATSSITKTLIGLGRPISQNTVDAYVRALVDSFLFYKVDRYNIKGKAVLKTFNKYYITDTGLRNAILSSENLDIGYQIENIVFLELLRRGYRVNIGKVDDQEIDFVAAKLNTKEYYQVSASVLDDQTLQRELAPLRRTGDQYAKFLITLDDFGGNHEGIRQINLIDWLLNRE